MADTRAARWARHARVRLRQAVVVPSLTFEISSGVIMEAFARRTLVVARDIGSIPEFAESAGLLYDSDEMLAGHIQTLMQLPDRARAMDDLGYTPYREQWTEDAFLRRYFSIIDDNERNRRSGASGRARNPKQLAV